MKKPILAVIIALILAPVTFGQTMSEVGLLNLRNYSEYFGFQGGRIDPASRYVVSAPRAERREFSHLAGNDVQIDTPLEFALLSYYSPAVVQIRPVEADAMLPANNPRLAGLKLASAVLHELAEVKFLTSQDTAAVGRYEGMVRFIQDRHGLTRAEIDNHYRTAVRAEVREPVYREFNRMGGFILSNARTNSVRDHNAVLTRNPQNGHYTLHYSGAYTINGEQEITAPTLDALLAEMGRRRTDFDQTGIDNLRAQAALIPAVFYADLTTRGEADALELIIESIVNFYVNPSQDNYNTLAGINARILINALPGNTAFFANRAYGQALREVWGELNTRIAEDIRRNRDLTVLARYPADPRFDVFARGR